MKIKKLFHWLYAILMLLPVFYIGGRVLYTIFNKNAKDSYSGFYESSLIVDYDNYTITIEKDYLNNRLFPEFTQLLQRDNNYQQVSILSYNDLDYTNVVYGTTSIFWDNNDNIQTRINLYFNADAGANIPRYKFIYRVIGDTYYDFDDAMTLYISNALFNQALSALNYDVGYYFNPNNNLDNAFEYSVNQLNDVPLFSWAQNSFLNEPFTYISGLFGIAASNPINTMLSYWLSISIIWLVFDLVMYVPLLVHRWIDKGGID